MKNENGTGTVYKLTGKRRKPWVARITTGYSLEGKQIRKTLGTFPTKREAQEYLYKYLKNPLLFNKITFGEVLEMWWAEHEKKLKESTAKNTSYHFPVFECLKNKAIADITLLELQNIFVEGLGSQSKIKSILNMVFDYALKYDFVEKNKVNFIELKDGKRKVKRQIFSKEEIEELWKNRNNKICKLVLILIYSGLRIGELIGLKKDDIDLNDNFFIIRQSKTDAGVRQVPIHSKIVPLILDILKNDEKLYDKNYFAFVYEFKKICKNHTVHDTRHTFASLLNNADANSTSITKLIGHTNFNLTENIYTHKDIKELKKAIELIN